MFGLKVILACLEFLDAETAAIYYETSMTSSDHDFLTLKTKVKVFSKYVSIWKRMQDIFVCRVKMRMLGTRKP